ncbi:MAG: DUF554 domain-containing protein [Firmicutes bacterium]|nr:DUF554 domain-containing protein [Bacillota bacterium]
MTGTLVNAISIVAGATIGVRLKKGLPERIKKTVIQGIGLSVILIGLQMSLQTQNILIVILSLAFGGLTGELINIEGLLARLGKRLESHFGGGNGDFTKAFVTASLLYCVGAMAIMGSIEDGLNNNPRILFAKSLLDGVSAVIFASTMGSGVIFSSLPVLLYQGSITILAFYLKDFLTPAAVAEMTSTGGLLILAIGLSLLGFKELKTGNLLPAIFFAPALVILAGMIPGPPFFK